MCADHREPVAERHDDRGLRAGERLGHDDVLGDRRTPPAGRVVEPVHAEEVQRVRLVRLDRSQRVHRGRGNPRGLSELSKRGQHDARVTESLDGPAVGAAIDDIGLKS